MQKHLNWKNAESFILLLALLLLASISSPVSAAPSNQGEDPQAEAEKLFSEGNALLEVGQYQAALETFETALPLYQEAGDRFGEGSCLLFIGTIKQGLADFVGALDAYQDSVLIWKEIGDQTGESLTLNNIGVVYDSLGRYQDALDYYKRALKIAQEIRHREGEVKTLGNIGVVYESLGQYQEALDYQQQALKIAQEIDDRYEEGLALGHIGFIYDNSGQYQKALDYYQQALAITQELSDRSAEVTLLTNIGRIYNYLVQYQNALDYYQQSLTIAKEIGDQDAEGIALSNIGLVYDSLGQYQKALDYYQQSLTIAKETGDRDGEGTILGNIGLVYDNLGQYKYALDYNQQSLKIAKEVGDRDGEGIALNNIGLVYNNLGQYPVALDYYQQALAIVKDIGHREGEGKTLNNIGIIYHNLGQYQQALDYYQQTLKIAQEIGDRVVEGITLDNIGSVYDKLEQYQQALDYSQQALKIAQEIGDRDGEGTILNNLGHVYNNLGQYQQALDYYQQALVISREIEDRPTEGIALHNTGFTYKQQGDTAQAIQFFQESVEVLESIQGEIKVEELKASFAAEQSAVYENLIDLLWEEARGEEAFNYAERARARAFLDQLGSGRIDFRAGIDADLLESEQALRSEISALRDQLGNLRAQPSMEGSNESIAEVANTLAAREADYAQLLTEIKLQSLEVASLVSVDVASLEDIQSLLDTNTTLVEYFVAEERVLVFIITQDTFETVAVDVNWDDLTQTITDFRSFASLEDPHPASLKQLHAWLIAPLKDKLKNPVLGIVPHGVLHYIPFPALTDGTHYLSEKYTIFSLPSASALRFLQEKRKPEVHTVLALGNPITELSDLQAAEQEARFIASLYGTQAWIGRDATESTVRAQASDAGILHLAAHGEYNPNNPLFSTIHLTGDSENDGRLEVHEIFGLNLTNATGLVVLSACETNVGAVSAGDEVVGLNRAFLYAGTPTVMASLWNVDDEATALLMEQFYTRLQEGMSKGEALRQAQDEVRAKYPHPYYWAAFVLTGDPGSTDQPASISFPQANNWMQQLGRLGGLLLGIGCIGIIGLLAGLAFWWRRRRV